MTGFICCFVSNMFDMSDPYNRLRRPKPQELTPIGVRDVDAKVWREIKAEAFRQGVPIARLLEAIWAFWVFVFTLAVVIHEEPELRATFGAE